MSRRDMACPSQMQVRTQATWKQAKLPSKTYMTLSGGEVVRFCLDFRLAQMLVSLLPGVDWHRDALSHDSDSHELAPAAKPPGYSTSSAPWRVCAVSLQRHGGHGRGR